MHPQNIVILSGAGISAESGIKTFRDANGLWEGHDVLSVASPEGWRQNPKLVLDFYNQRRRQLFEVSPNDAHQRIAHLEKEYNVTVITQNVDDLHERAGSSTVIHLHGKLRSVRSEQNPALRYDWEGDLQLGDMAEDGAQLRPDIVWFGEDVPMMMPAIQTVSAADIVIIIGTSMQVYPAASLYQYASAHAKIYYIDPNAEQQAVSGHVICITETATAGMAKLIDNDFLACKRV